MKLDYGEKSDIRRGKYYQIWQATSSFLNCFSESLSLNTCFWILEIFALMSQKFNFSDLMGEVYNDYYKVLNGSIEYISAFAAGKLKISFETFLEPGIDVTPLCPSIYEIDQKYPDKKLLSDSKYRIINEILKDEFVYEEEVRRKYKFHCFKVLSNIVKTPLFYQGENTKFDRLNLRVSCITNHLFSVMYDRMPDNLHIIESASEVINNLLCTNPNKYIVRELKKDILDIYNMDTFFKCT